MCKLWAWFFHKISPWETTHFSALYIPLRQLYPALLIIANSANIIHIHIISRPAFQEHNFYDITRNFTTFSLFLSFSVLFVGGKKKLSEAVYFVLVLSFILFQSFCLPLSFSLTFIFSTFISFLLYEHERFPLFSCILFSILFLQYYFLFFLACFGIALLETSGFY